MCHRLKKVEQYFFDGLPHLVTYIFLIFFHELTRNGCRNWSWHGFDINHFHLVFWIRRDSNPQSLDHESSLLTTRPDLHPQGWEALRWTNGLHFYFVYPLFIEAYFVSLVANVQKIHPCLIRVKPELRKKWIFFRGVNHNYLFWVKVGVRPSIDFSSGN